MVRKILGKTTVASTHEKIKKEKHEYHEAKVIELKLYHEQ